MVEIVFRPVTHANLLHHAPRREVRRYGERHDLIEPEHIEGVGEHHPRALGSKPLIPVLGGNSPPGFNARCEVSREVRYGKPDEADEAALSAQFGGKQSEPAFLEARFVEHLTAARGFLRPTTSRP